MLSYITITRCNQQDIPAQASRSLQYNAWSVKSATTSENNQFNHYTNRSISHFHPLNSKLSLKLKAHCFITESTADASTVQKKNTCETITNEILTNCCFSLSPRLSSKVWTSVSLSVCEKTLCQHKIITKIQNCPALIQTIWLQNSPLCLLLHPK